MSHTTLAEDLRKLRALKLRKIEAKAAADKAADEHAMHEALVWERMEDENTTAQRTDEITFGAQDRVFAQIVDRDKFNEWAEQNDEMLLEKRERKADLNALVRRRLDDDEPLPPGVGFYHKRYISQRAN